MCDNRDMFLAARNTMGDDIDVSGKPNQDEDEEEHESVVEALKKESVFHGEAHAEDDGLINDYLSVDFGYDYIEEVGKELQDQIREARNNGLSEKGSRKS